MTILNTLLGKPVAAAASLYKPTFKENVAGLILDWCDDNKLTGSLNIAVLASRIDRLKNDR